MSVSVIPPFDFAVGRFRVNCSEDRLQLDVAERIPNRDVSRAGIALDAAVVGGDAHAVSHVEKRYTPEAIGDFSGASHALNVHIPVVVTNNQLTSDGADLYVTEGSSDIGGPRIHKINGAVAAGDGNRPLNALRSDISEAVAHIERASHIFCTNGAVVVIHGDIPGRTIELNAPERIVQPRGSRIPDCKCAVAVFDIGGAVDTGHVHAAETVPYGKRRVGRHADVIAHGPGRALAQVKPFPFFFGINGFDAYAFAGLQNFDLYFLRERLGLLMRAGLCADRGGDFDVPAGFAMEPDLAELVFDADGLAGAQRHGLLKISRDLLLCQIRGKRGLCSDEKQRRKNSRDRCETQKSVPRCGYGGVHCFLASRTSSSVCCFS